MNPQDPLLKRFDAILENLQSVKRAFQATPMTPEDQAAMQAQQQAAMQGGGQPMMDPAQAAAMQGQGMPAAPVDPQIGEAIGQLMSSVDQLAGAVEQIAQQVAASKQQIDKMNQEFVAYKERTDQLVSALRATAPMEGL
jgi:outer membrane murein-binding lipoprotein Lpp